MLQIEEHKIRYWDSKDPKTKKYRIEGISTKSKGGTRYFNRENIRKLQQLKNILHDGNSHKYSIKLAQKLLYSNSKSNIQNNQIQVDNSNLNNLKKIEQILDKMRILLKNDSKR